MRGAVAIAPLRGGLAGPAAARAVLSGVIPLLSCCCCCCLGAAGVVARRCRCPGQGGAHSAHGLRLPCTPGGGRRDAAFCAPGLGLHLAMCGPHCDDVGLGLSGAYARSGAGRQHLQVPIDTRIRFQPAVILSSGARWRQAASLRCGFRSAIVGLKGGSPSSSHFFSRVEGKSKGRGMSRAEVCVLALIYSIVTCSARPYSIGEVSSPWLVTGAGGVPDQAPKGSGKDAAPDGDRRALFKPEDGAVGSGLAEYCYSGRSADGSFRRPRGIG